MEFKQALATSLGHGQFVVDAYLADLTDQDLMARAVPGCNHIAWQLGHLITSEWYLAEQCAPGRMTPLPEGWGKPYGRGTSATDNVGEYHKKEELVRVAKQVRADTLKLIEGLDAADFAKPVAKVPPMLKTAGETLLFISSHWLMHAGQWALIRRKIGRPPLF